MLVAENAQVSQELAAAVKRLVSDARRDIAVGTLEADAIKRLGTGALIVAVVLSLVSSTLIVWLYVGRSLIARLTALSDSMLAIARGDLEAAIPPSSADEIGAMADALTVFRDTAVEMKRANLREIREARTRLMDAIETIQEGFALYDADDRLVLCNSQYRELLYPGTDDVMVTGTPFETVLRIEAERGLIRDALGREEKWVMERLAKHREPCGPHLQQRSDGHWIQINERKTETGSTVAVYSDITDLKRAQLEAEEADQAKSRFLAGVSHDLRTPLNAIIGFTRLVMRRTRDDLPEKQYANLEKIKISADHLLALIDDILDYTRTEEVVSVEVGLDGMVEECLRAVEPMVRNRRVQLAKELAPDLPRLFTDGRKLKRILINLLSNAVEFTEEGRVCVSARPRDGEVDVCVEDTGVGIPQEALARIFEEFEQAHAHEMRRSPGTGLGLAISRRFSELIGGRICVQSEVGVGSAFTLTIPIRYHSSAIDGGASDPGAA